MRLYLSETAQLFDGDKLVFLVEIDHMPVSEDCLWSKRHVDLKNFNINVAVNQLQHLSSAGHYKFKFGLLSNKSRKKTELLLVYVVNLIEDESVIVLEIYCWEVIYEQV